jgi:hypothetical protein
MTAAEHLLAIIEETIHGQRVLAIKYLREVTNLGLHEAHDMVRSCDFTAMRPLIEAFVNDEFDYNCNQDLSCTVGGYYPDYDGQTFETAASFLSHEQFFRLRKLGVLRNDEEMELFGNWIKDSS